MSGIHAGSIRKCFLRCKDRTFKTWRLQRTDVKNTHGVWPDSTSLPRVSQQRSFHTTDPNRINPIFAVLLKNSGVKVLKVLSILFGRSFRKLHSKLPESVRDRLGKHKIFFSVLGVSAPFIGYYSYTHYDTCPITGRKRWITFTKDQVKVLSDLDYDQITEQFKDKLLNESHPIFKKNAELVTQLINGNSDIDFVKNTEWTLHVIEDQTVTNACVLPNGHIFVFTGMLKMLNTWEEMAVILGHEMSHAILGHSQEQQSYLAFGELITIPFLAFIWFFFEDFAAFLIYSIQQYIYPIIFEYGFSLPYSRLLETEADEVGLLLAAKACFDPRWSVFLWEKMAMKEVLDGHGAEDEFDFLSTHPGNQKRSVLLEQRLPEVMEKRKQCNCPPLPPDIDPQVAAHNMRKCVENVKERKALMEELDQNNKLLDEKSYIKREETKPSTDENLQKIRNANEDIKQKLLKLSFEYQLLTNTVPPESNKLENTEPKKEGINKEKSGVLANLWGKIVGSVSTTGQLTDTLFEKEGCELHTVNLEKSAFGEAKE